MSANKALRRLHRRILSLREEVDNLQCLLNDSDEARQSDERHASEERWAIQQRAEREHRCLEENARRDREKAQSRAYARDSVVRDLERAVDWKRITGRDPFGDIDRCTQKLRRM